MTIIRLFRLFTKPSIVGLLENCDFQVAAEFRGEKPACKVRMQRRLKTIQVLLFIAASVLVLGFSAYFYCSNLARLHFRSSDLSLENLERKNTRIDRIHDLKRSRSNGCFDVLVLIRNIPKQSPSIGFLRPCLDQETVMLRC
jgi:hypothetical protein